MRFDETVGKRKAILSRTAGLSEGKGLLIFTEVLQVPKSNPEMYIKQVSKGEKGEGGLI